MPVQQETARTFRPGECAAAASAQGGQHRWLLLLCTAAFALRVTAAVAGPDHFWSYTAYFQMATVLAKGGGYCLTPDGGQCAYFPPVYPTILAACILTGHAKAAIIV